MLAKIKDACQNDNMIVLYIGTVLTVLITLGMNVLAHYPVGH
ncbi:MAG: hypothetical protein ACOY4D_01330 [Pseudomonadota bacterium]